jgi:enoyl-[acyl-carrier protein] reductase III
LILGASSGFGAAAAVALAGKGFNIIGVHLDRKTTISNAENTSGAILAAGRKALFFNCNAADQDRRADVLRKCMEIVLEHPDSNGISLMLHSLAFGTLKPYISPNQQERIKPADMNMTLDVMAHSLVYWTQDLFHEGLLKSGSKVFAMTSAGSHRIWPSYGAVSAAKAALESHVRQLAVELGPFGVAVNAIQAGVTDTPAARRIPGNEWMFKRAKESNPGKRLTTPEDAAEFIAALALLDSCWTTGNVIRVDGGEDLV